MRRFGVGALALLVVVLLLPGQRSLAAGPLVVGVVDSEETYVNFSQLGWWTERPPRLAQALADAGFTVITLDDADLANPTRLASVDVVFLPLTRVMSEDAALTLREWVGEGGALVGSFISPRMLARPGCYWLGSDHPRNTADVVANWTCSGTSHGGFEFWARELKSAVWEYGPLSDVYQNVLINDPSPKEFSVVEGASHPIVTQTKAVLGIRSIQLDRPSGAGAEFVRLFNTNTTSILAFDIPPGTGSGEGVDASQYDGYTAAQAVRYGEGRAVYFDFDILDFLPGINFANSQQTHDGVTQGVIALELLTQAIEWATSPSTGVTMSRDARTWAEVDVYNTGIYLRQKIVAEGNMPVTGTMSARIYDPGGVLAYENSRELIGLYPGGPVLSFSLPGYIVGSGLRTDGAYRVEVMYVYTYPDYRLVHLEEVQVLRNQGIGITTSQAYAGSLPSRLAGVDRYDTAAAISKSVFAPGTEVAYIATANNFPDALAGSAAAAGRGPILLVTPTAIPGATATELNRLQPGKIVVLGGTGAVSAAVESQLSSYTAGPVTRLAGADRYATAAAISAAHFAPDVPVAFVATGENFPDALAGGPAASALGGPILLTAKTQLPAATAAELTRLRPGKIVVLGGAGAVSAAVVSALDGYTGGTVERVAGSDRYATAAAISSSAFAPGVPVVYVSTGIDFPDALAGGSAGAALGGPVLLVSPISIPSATKNELSRLTPSKIVVLGGVGVVSESVRVALAVYEAG